jgi:hypothetical protein
LITEPEKRFFVWNKASKSRMPSVAAALRSGERGADNGKGAVLPDEGRSLHGGRSPWTG